MFKRHENNSPCINCPPISSNSKRCVGCHSTCLEYIKWNTERNEYLEERHNIIEFQQLNKRIRDSRYKAMTTNRSSNNIRGI